MNYQNENFNGSYELRSRFHDGYRIALHLHEYSELLYCLEGEGIANVNGKPIPLSAGQLLWIAPNFLHEYDFPQAQVICAVFSADLIPLYFRQSQGRPLRPQPLNAKSLEPLIRELPQLSGDQLLRISGNLNLICDLVLSQSHFGLGEPTDGILLQRVISYLSQHYSEDLTLRQIAHQFGYNEKYLSHTLYATTGIHFRRLLAMYRIQKATALLCESPRRSVSDVAIQCGYSAFNTFRRMFRETTGMTPSAYRKKYS